MKRLLPVLLVLGACNPPPASDVAVSGPPVTDAPEVLGIGVVRHDFTPAPTTTIPAVVPATVAPPVVVTTTAPVVPLTAAPPVPAAPTGNVHAAISAHFGTGALGRSAQRVAGCESHMNPGAVSPTNDHGLFQLHAGSANFPGGWVETFQQVTGVPFFDGVYDPALNAQFARWLWDRSGWQPWACRSAA